eukprot:1153064-Pelagomonas_calceolata.AAC.1
MSGWKLVRHPQQISQRNQNGVMSSCQVQDGNLLEDSYWAGMYHPMSDSKNLVEPNGAGVTNTIGRAELAAIAAALTH